MGSRRAWRACRGELIRTAADAGFGGAVAIGTLSSLISKTIFAISAEESRFTLNGALLLLRGRKITMVATDGHRLAMVELENLLEVEANYRALLPRKAMES